MKKIILIMLTVFLTLGFTSCTIDDNETLLEESELYQDTGGDDEGEIPPPPPPVNP
ncbi:hypothetical protein [Tenacibaculum sp. IB213877]|uniref:hypothetical protein n=1 Tax=Tenacibaculum sp. IB213877 TaxID=3097351 RepID=UPI002A59EC37|nr:hypothetical protein [Tenacibaculum sp. IB213877]MDY0780962.1 hypothetical protein [Tenacibaculum sp. IB213877]